MKISDNIFSKKDGPKLIDNSPCLAPWYFTKDSPTLIKERTKLKWKAIGSQGITALMDESRNFYGLLDMVCYVLASDDSKSFLIWQRHLEEIAELQSVNIFYYNVDELKPIPNKDKAIAQMKRGKQSFFFGIRTSINVTLTINPRTEAMKFDFPDEFKKFGEFIVLTELQNLYENPDPKYWNTTMICINPESGWIFNYPQDWFNKSNADFMYQWITRAKRNPKTNLIHGQGIRLTDFVLDETNRQRLDKR